MTEPVTNGTEADVLTIHVRRQLRRSDATLSEWLIVDRVTTGDASDRMPLYVQVRDHVASADNLGSATHASPISAPEAVSGAVEVPCQAQTAVPVRWNARPYQRGAVKRIPLAV